MAREYNGDGYENEGQLYLWIANVERSIKGKRGQRELRFLRDALLALPEKKLIRGALCTMQRSPHDSVGVEAAENKGEGVCAIGAYAWWKRVQRGLSPEAAFAALPTGDDSEYDLDYTASLGEEGGFSFTLAWHIAERNDHEYWSLTPEARYERFMKWLNEKIVA